MSERRSNLVMAAMASAALPTIGVAGVRDSEQDNETDREAGIQQAVVQDVRGIQYTVYVTERKAGKKRLRGRWKAAKAIAATHEFAGLGFRVDHAVAFSADESDDDIAGEPSILMTIHPDGVSRSLDLLTLDDCASVGTAIGTIHRMRPNFIVQSGYPQYSTEQIRAQLTAWIQRLRAAGHVPTEITDSWASIMQTDGLWSFHTCPVHGGFSDGDLLFSGSTITTITNWQEMQINDPARDLAWIFSKLDETHRNAVLAAYGRILGNRLDDLIMLRANLWVQMEQVGEFIQALNRGDNTKIIQFKAMVDKLAHEIGVTRRRNEANGTAGPGAREGRSEKPSTVTVNTLLRNERKEPPEPAQETHTGSHGKHAGRAEDYNPSVDAPTIVEPAVSRAVAEASMSWTGVDERNTMRPDLHLVDAQHDSTSNANVAVNMEVSEVIDVTIDGTVNNTVDGTEDGTAEGLAAQHSAAEVMSDATGESIAAAVADLTGEAEILNSSEDDDITGEREQVVAESVDVEHQAQLDDTTSDSFSFDGILTYSGVVEGVKRNGSRNATAAPEDESDDTGDGTASSAMPHVIANISEHTGYVDVSQAQAAAWMSEDDFGTGTAQTIILNDESNSTNDTSNNSSAQHDGDDSDSPETVLIPLLEREEKAMRDARGLIDEQHKTRHSGNSEQ